MDLKKESWDRLMFSNGVSERCFGSWQGPAFSRHSPLLCFISSGIYKIYKIIQQPKADPSPCLLH